jgi:SAM-dependent methyltransferase
VTRLESDYYAYMGYDSDRARAALAHYLSFFPAGPVLELACGRGEFLDLLRDAGVPARGVDLDEGMVERAVARGHDVVLGEAVGHLEKVEPGTRGGLFCAHFLEHLEPADVVRVYEAAARALRPGAAFVAVVPNAGSLSVLGYDFWRDPTHVRFYDPDLLSFFAAQAGLTIAEAGGNPRNDPGPPPQLWPQQFEPVAPLSGSVSELLTAAGKVYPAIERPTARRQRRNHGNHGNHHDHHDHRDTENGAPTATADPRADLWAHAAHLVALLDQRVQTVQHQLAELHRAYRALVTQLYPASEVYVVALVPVDGEDLG